MDKPRYAVRFPDAVSSTLKKQREPDMAKNHYSTKPKRRNRSGKRKDTQRIAANMAKIKQLEKGSGRTA